MDSVKKYSGWVLGALVVGLLIALFQYFELRTVFTEWFKHDMKPWLAENPFLAPFIYILIYVVSVVAFLPGSVPTLAGGAIFGPILGTIYVSFASTGAAAISFLVARYLAADWVESKASGKLSTIKEGIEAEGTRFVAFTRLIPIFPYTLLNYMFGLTKIRFWTYVWVSWMCMLPGTFAYVYAGHAGRKVVLGEGGIGRQLIWIVSGIGVLVLASMIPKIVKMVSNDDVDEVINDIDED